jgi:hypothetical protein
MAVADQAATHEQEDNPVHRATKYAASLLSAGAIVATVGLAPVAAAATHLGTPGTPSPASQRATEPPASGDGDGYGYGYGVDPFVLSDTGAQPFALVPPGDDLAF